MLTMTLLTLISVVVLTHGDSEGVEKALDLRIPLARIPPTPTYYVCQQFEVPADRQYHAVRFEPLITNPDLVHHILLFGCQFEMDSKGPHPCGDLDNRCRSWLVKWDMGMEGIIAMPDDVGVRFGQGSFKHLLLQVHWNNAGSLDNRTDDSGLRIHYTADLRKHSAGNVQIGQNQLAVPAQTTNYHVTGGCSSTCTKLMLPHPIYITRVYMHMHSLGTSARLQSVDNHGNTVREIARDKDYNYTSPVVHLLTPAVKVNPGEELRLECIYDSKTGSRSRDHDVSFGQGAESEMCYAFLSYFPGVVGFDQCLKDGAADLNCVLHTDT